MSKAKKVCVVGLGYVGLPLALLAAKKYDVVGIDNVKEKISSLNSHQSYIDDVSADQLAESSAVFTTDFSEIADADITIICVPTPVDEHKTPDLSPVIGATESSAKFLKKGSLLVVESTINPGVCDDVVIPIVEKVSGMKVSEDVHLAHCPERINPGDPKWNVSNINRVVGSNSEQGLNAAYEFYSSIIDAEIKKMTSLKEAEAVKVVENSFRDINIAFVNELAMSFHKLGINLENVIDGAATKPFAFMPHHPSVGVGGHCIPVDPYYLIEYAGSYGFQHKFLSLAREINESMPAFTMSLMKELEQESELKDKHVTVLGLSYKPNVADLRESPSKRLISLLKSGGYEVTVYDPYFPDNSDAATLDEALKASPRVVLATGHTVFRDELSAKRLSEAGVKLFVDGRNLFHHDKPAFEAAGIGYMGIGT